MSKNKVYLVIYVDPWEECPECDVGIEGYPEILATCFTRKSAEEYLAKRIQEGAKYLEGRTEIREMEVE